MAGKLRVRLRKSPISYTAQARGTVRALGLHRLNDTSELPDTPAVRGMVRAVRFLVEVEELPGAGHSSAAAPDAGGQADDAGEAKEETT